MSSQGPPETTGIWRVLRGTVVGGATAGLALAGHLAGGGPAVPLSVLAGMVLGVAVIGIGLSRFSWTLPRLLAVLLATQPPLHLLFGWTSAATSLQPQTDPAVQHSGHAYGVVVTPPEPITQAVSEWPMLAGHVAAALGTALVLRRGEQWLGDVLDALGLRALRLLRAPLVAYGARPQPIPIRAHHLPHRHDPADAWWQRGPPR